jgi:hypothetical protein
METNEVKETNKNWKVGDGTAGPGRPSGVPNKSTAVVRNAIATLLEKNVPYMDRWLQRVAEGDEVYGLKPDPAKALDLMQKLSEYHIPKLARTEVTGMDGAPQQHVVTWQK